MIHIKNHKARYFFNPFEHLGPKRLALLESSWAHLFREEILHRLPVEKLFPVYNEFKGRKTKELFAMPGIVLLQQMEDRTDGETVRRFAFNLMWHYALNITDATDVSSSIAPRTLWAMRDTAGRPGPEQSLLENVTDILRKLFGLDPSRQRLGSVHIFSNMAHPGRIRKFPVNLKRHHAGEYQGFGDIALRYEERNDGQFAVKPGESARTLQGRRTGVRHDQLSAPGSAVHRAMCRWTNRQRLRRGDQAEQGGQFTPAPRILMPVTAATRGRATGCR